MYSQPEEVFTDDLTISENAKKELLELLKQRMVQQPVKIKSDFLLVCYKFEGIDAIKFALQQGEKLSTKEIPIKFRIVSSPLYECSIFTTNKTEGIKLVEKALKAVESSIKEKGGNFLLQTNPKVATGDAKEDINEQLNQAKEKDNESSDGEEEIENHEEGINMDEEDKEEYNI